MTNKQIPFAEIVEIIDHLHTRELRNYCEEILTGRRDDEHIYKMLLVVLLWLEASPDCAQWAGNRLHEAYSEISAAERAAGYIDDAADQLCGIDSSLL
jgi:hypothetical protein